MSSTSVCHFLGCFACMRKGTDYTIGYILEFEEGDFIFDFQDDLQNYSQEVLITESKRNNEDLYMEFKEICDFLLIPKYQNSSSRPSRVRSPRVRCPCNFRMKKTFEGDFVISKLYIKDCVICDGKCSIIWEDSKTMEMFRK